MSVVRATAVALLGGTGAVLMAAGPIMAARGIKARAEIQTELRGQSITFPDKGLPNDLAAHQGRAVLTGSQARTFARVIGHNVLMATGGRTYGEISAELHAAGSDDEKLAGLQQTAFTGQMLRASLLNAYQAWQLTTLIIGLGALLTMTGAALIAASTAFAIAT
ncbi:hypothetical protein [Nonomuraea basaltis]|uniref:hypothetical protein n=1 Tax=Nonomuraea basaltis TaxID=2495887 RepID=UPI00110C6CDD|nr:hypothetical protein [Nonomuraea basaltis]TMR96843.1 hypothetical protein EJK15_21400 [Nonomuraea basaltis]